jgi:hypothetical protein
MATVIARASAIVLSVEERFQTVSGRKNPDGGVDLVKESLGWFIRITESSAIRVGATKPDVKIGDEIILTLEKP